MSSYSDDDYLRLLAKYNDANKRLDALETFVHAIAWGPPHIIEYNTYVNSLVDKAQKLCPRVAELYEFPQTKEKK